MIVELFRKCKDCDFKWRTYEQPLTTKSDDRTFAFCSIECPNCDSVCQTVTWKYRKFWTKVLRRFLDDSN